ncbi:MAG TPA: uroporphyrinogen-III synthase [Candidatus Marinimicrobia bacterium]|nr:uroporphyrinogen-III synthase [Candidatus Neomarinimicrobiota bacterium]
MKRIFLTGLRPPDIILPPDFALHHWSTIQIEFFEPSGSLQIQKPGYLFFLSQNGVLAFYLQQEKILPHLDDVEIWAVGKVTARAIQELFNIEAKVPIKQNAVGLTESFSNQEKKPALLITAEKARQEFLNFLKQNKWEFQRISLYRTILRNDLRWQQINFKHSDIILFTSPSAVSGFLQNRSFRKNERIPKIIAIGSSTALAVNEKLGIEPIIADEPNIDLIFKQIKTLGD